MIPVGQKEVELTIRAESTAAIRGTHLTICGRAKLGARQVTRIATLATVDNLPELETMLLAVTLPTPFKIVGHYDMRWAPRGTVFHRHYRVDRAGDQGPLEVSL